MYRTFLLYQSRSALVHLFKWHSLNFGVWFYVFTFFFSFLCCYYLLSLVFLGGLSSHLNHLIASHMTNYKWPFWTLFLDLFGQIWTQGTLRHILGPIMVIFEICQFLTIPGPFEYFSKNGWSQKIKVFLMKEWSLPPYQFSFRRRGS